MPTPNTPEIIAVYRDIEAHPEEHRQDAYAVRTDCGTAYCYAGRTVARAGYVAEFDGPDAFTYPVRGGGEGTPMAVDADGNQVSIHAKAKEILGLTDQQAADLFDADNDLGDLRELIALHFGVDPAEHIASVTS